MGLCRVNGKIQTHHAYKLKPKDEIDFLTVREATTIALQKRMHFDIVFEDEFLLVVNKPAKLLTIATENERERTLYFEVVR